LARTWPDCGAFNMGHAYRTESGTRLSPLTILRIMSRVEGGETAYSVAQEYSISSSTISRWLRRWGAEAKQLPQYILKDRGSLRVVDAQRREHAAANMC
jgi:transposase-like protein